jgi:adenylate cyclase
MAEKSANKKVLVAALIVAVVFTVVGLLQFFHAFDPLENKAYDYRVKYFADSNKPSDDIVVIVLDQYSIEWANKNWGWGWPWPRKAYADIVEFMSRGAAKSMAFDVLFTEPSIYRSADQDEIIDNAVKRMDELRESVSAFQFLPGGMPVVPPNAPSAILSAGQRAFTGEQQRQVYADYLAAMTALQSLSERADDNAFVQAVKEYGRVVQAVFFNTDSGSTETWPQDLHKPLLSLSGFDTIINKFGLDDDHLGALFPIPELKMASAALGHVTSSIDADEIHRRVKLFINFDGKAVPGLSAASLLISGNDNKIQYNEKKQQIEWGDYVIPVDSEGRSILRFRGSLNRYIPYSAADILRSLDTLRKDGEPIYSPSEFEGKYVFFGFYAPGLFDICATPLESAYPGMGMHITMLDNILSGDLIRESAEGANWTVLFAVILLTTALALFNDKLRFSIGGSVIIAAVIVAGAFIAYGSFCLWFPLILPLAGLLISFLTCTVYNYATEGSQKRFIKSAFSQYLSPAVIEQIIADPSNLELGGKSLDMSAIFTDIQRFSSISEGLQKAYGKDGPKELVNLLNLYLTEMSNIVLANEGTIDKFEGDAIIAFFGAPIPTARHAALACRSAVQMKKAEAAMTGRIMDKPGRFYPVLDALIEKKVIRADQPLYTRIGINSGEMVVGNMGTPSKMNYTIMGNAVNLAARLEGVNKQYDTGGILLSEYTRDKIGDDEFSLRPLSRVRVVGISTPVRLYELLDIRENASAELLEMIKDWEAAFKAYEGRGFPIALEGFKEIYRKNPGDLTALLYIKRCEEYLQTPPSDEEWDDGVDNLTSK